MNKLLILGVALTLALVATCWLGAYLDNRWAGACTAQGLVLAAGAVACFIRASRTAGPRP